MSGNVRIACRARCRRLGRRALLDLDLGDGDGDDVARALHARRPDLPVAFFSASTSAELVDRARAIGPVFAKPGELDAAVAWVRGHGAGGAK
jgi:DNA-binding NarL/FixJ family response regulator